MNKYSLLRLSFAGALVACLAASLTNSSLQAAVLTGSGPHLPIPAPNPAWPPGVGETRIQTGPTFVGAWAPPAHPDWDGL